jgi:hypothetical protein
VTEDQGSTPEREPEKRLPHLRKAAGAQITHSRRGEVVTKCNETVLFEARHRNGRDLNQPSEDLLEGKSGASSRGNSSSNSVY